MIAASVGLTREQFEALDTIEKEFIVFKVVQEPVLLATDPASLQANAARKALLKGLSTFIAPSDVSRINTLVEKAKSKDKFNKDLTQIQRKASLTSELVRRREVGQVVAQVRQFGGTVEDFLAEDLLKILGKRGTVIDGKIVAEVGSVDQSKFLLAMARQRQGVSPGFALGTNTGSALDLVTVDLLGRKSYQAAFVMNQRLQQAGASTGVGGSVFMQLISRLRPKGVIKPQGLSLLGGTNIIEQMVQLKIGGGGIAAGAIGFAQANFNTLDAQEQFLTAFAETGSVSTALSDIAQVSTPAHILSRIKIEDRNRKLLAFGGKRRVDKDGFLIPLSDPNAVIGGVTSRSAFREQSRRQRRFNLNFAGSFGIRVPRYNQGGGIVSSILGRLGRAGLLNTFNRQRRRTVASNQSILNLANIKIGLGETLFGIDPTFIEGLIASMNAAQLQLRIESENRFINETDAQLEEDRAEIIKIRFDQSRGDRELLNRLRFNEMLDAASSGTSPI